MTITDHFMSQVQAARHFAEETVAVADQLDADFIARTVATVKRHLANADAAVADNGGALFTEMRQRAVNALAKLEQR